MKQKKDVLLVFLIGLALLLHFFNPEATWTESHYSSGFYAPFSSLLRFLTGKIGFSIGDCLYGFAFLLILFGLYRFSKAVFQKKATRLYCWNGIKKILNICIIIYIVFVVFWGLNYSRLGIASQIGLKLTRYDVNELKEINAMLVEKVNISKRAVVKNKIKYNDDKELFKHTEIAYAESFKSYDFLKYQNSSIKTSMWGWLGNYWGFTGYYNPFTAEAQLNTTVPEFILPFSACHEVAHQLGYAKEKEANFVAYLVAKATADSLLLYSAYLNLFFYANRNLYNGDSTAAKQYREFLSADVKKDIFELRQFNEAHRNFMEPMITRLYDVFLRSNQQPQGMMSYDEVTVYLVSYYRKFGSI